MSETRLCSVELIRPLLNWLAANEMMARAVQCNVVCAVHTVF